MKFIRKLFVKDYQDTQNPKVRTRYGLSAGIFGIVTNAILFAFKLAIGLIGNSITIVADAINNLSDAGSRSNARRIQAIRRTARQRPPLRTRKIRIYRFSVRVGGGAFYRHNAL